MTKLPKKFWERIVRKIQNKLIVKGGLPCYNSTNIHMGRFCQPGSGEMAIKTAFLRWMAEKTEVCMKKIKELMERYKHGWAFLYILIYVPWYLYLERTVVTEFHVMHTWIDDIIPFNPYFILPYGFWFLYVTFMLVFLFLKDADEFYRFGLYLALGMSASLFICQIFPNGTNLRPVNLDPHANWASFVVSLIYKADTNTNVFPSIHVYNAIGTHIALVKSRFFVHHRGVKAFSLLAMISICLSTMFLKQHSALDVIGAAVLCYLTYQLVYARVALPIKERKKITV